MTLTWLVLYGVLWLVVVALGVCMVGVLRQVGQLRLRSGADSTSKAPPVPRASDDGPPLGSRMRDFVADTANDFGPITLNLLQEPRATLMVFLSPTGESCQYLVESLNALAGGADSALRCIVIMRADEYACRAFISVFPLRVPLVCDQERFITRSFDVHRHPFALLYNEQGLLAGKGETFGSDDLQRLLHPVSSTGQTPRAFAL